MVERRLPRLKTREYFYKKGQKKMGGRAPGSKNKIGLELKEAILKAIELCGSDKNGKGGAVGYLWNIAATKPELMMPLLAKVLPMTVVGEGGGPIRIMPIPPEVLADCSDEQLAVMQALYERMSASGSNRLLMNGGGNGQVIDAEANSYAEEIGIGKT